ncbi:MAG: hypothetical protein AB8C13_05305 [Phycisphaerales bacterium]
MKFRTDVCTVLSVIVSMCFALPLFAQGVGAPASSRLEEPRDRDGQLDAILKEMPEDAERRVRDALAPNPISVDQSGIDPFVEEWTEILPGFINDQTPSFIEFDLEGNLIVVFDIESSQTVVSKFDITPTNGPTLVWQVDVPGALGNARALDLEVDIDGNMYIPWAFTASGDLNTYVTKISKEGFVRWNNVYPLPEGGAYNKNIRTSLSEEGVLFMLTMTFDILSNDYDYVVTQIDPATGVEAFRVDAEDFAQQQFVGLIGEVEVGFDGGIYARTELSNGQSTVSRIGLSPSDEEWSVTIPVSMSRDVVADHLTPRRAGGVWASGQDLFTGDGAFYIVTEGSSIGLVYRATNSDSAVVNVIHEFRDQSIAYGGSITRNSVNGGFIGRFNLDDFSLFTNELNDLPGTTPSVSDSVLAGFVDVKRDRTGNIYGLYRFYPNNEDGDFLSVQYKVLKLDESGAEIWRINETPNLVGVGSVRPVGMDVDGGGNVVVSSVAKPTFGFESNLQLDKYSQPFLGVPTIQTASATLSFEDQSIWAPGVGNLVAQEELFTVDWDENLSIDATFTVPLLGEFGGDFMFLTSGTLDTGVRAEVDGGTADVHFPIDIQFGIPPVAKVSTGQLVTIAVDWDVDPAARLTSCFTPTFNAGLTAAVDYSVFSSLRLVAFSSDLLNTTFINDAEVIDEDYVPEANLLDILAGQGFLVPGEWASFEDPNGIVSADFRTPQMFAQGMYDPVTNSFSTSADDRFFRFGVSVTEAVLKPFALTATAEFEAGTAGGEFLVRGAGAALQLGARADIGASQDIDVGVTPMITYDFVGNENIPSQTLPLGVDLNFTVPSGFDGVIEIIPTITATADFFNSTDIEMFPGITWDTIEVSGAASAFGFDLIDFGPECLFCYDWDVSEILEALGADPGLADFTVNVFDDGWQIPLQSVTLPCIRVLGTSILDNPPNIEGASRESLSMVIYDQTSPSVSSFNVATAGTSKMILYGERFANGSVGMIEHWGRTESLPTTFINPNTLLVEIPNRFRLLPGVAKLFVETSVKSKVVVSDTIDLAINFPVPRLDAVNPNLWAADPDLAVLPVSVIDAKSFAGNDTFISRRDYYIKMRDDLWSDSTDGGFVGGAAQYFPGFDFNKLPEFPSVLWSSKGETLPLPRFVQPVDNGIHNVRLAEDQYDVPMMVPVVICNPGPGGGMSNELMLTIAAPAPVTSSVMPSNFSPLDVILDDNFFDPMDVPVERPIELRITGPTHVPTFNGYEEPKFGNFNAASVVRFNGLDIPTTFISSSLLIAQLPADLATLGDHWISVSTPSNGTQYFEEQRVDADFDGMPDDVPAFQGLVDSGGESAPLLFRVRYREPVIAEVLPALIDQDSPAFDDSNFKEPRPFNLTLLGEDFREGAQVFFNGQLRSSQVIDSTVMKVKLLPADVSMLGTFDIMVQNPFPQGDQSVPAAITVSDLDLIQMKGP